MGLRGYSPQDVRWASTAGLSCFPVNLLSDRLMAWACGLQQEGMWRERLVNLVQRLGDISFCLAFGAPSGT